jgi:hypothetical protein
MAELLGDLPQSLGVKANILKKKNPSCLILSIHNS